MSRLEILLVAFCITTLAVEILSLEEQHKKPIAESSNISSTAIEKNLTTGAANKSSDIPKIRKVSPVDGFGQDEKKLPPKTANSTANTIQSATNSTIAEKTSGNMVKVADNIYINVRPNASTPLVTDVVKDGNVSSETRLNKTATNSDIGAKISEVTHAQININTNTSTNSTDNKQASVTQPVSMPVNSTGITNSVNTSSTSTPAKSVSSPNITETSSTNKSIAPTTSSTKSATSTTTTSTTTTTTTKPTPTTTTTTTTTTTPKPKKPKISYSVEDFPDLDKDVLAKLNYTQKHDASATSKLPSPEVPFAQPSQEFNNSSFHGRQDYILPVVSMIFIIPLVIGAFITTYRRFRDCWSTRHYRRMDFLVDGMYND